MSDSSSQSEEKPGATNFTSKNNTYNIRAHNFHMGQGDNNTSEKGMTMS